MANIPCGICGAKLEIFTDRMKKEKKVKCNNCGREKTMKYKPKD
jgi:DNA-directed RNA polymerase subunit RPC12/RpoP